jgi:hypothetical protein
MVDTKKTIAELNRLLEPEGRDDPKRAELPERAEVLYTEPAPGGESRSCANCVLWSPLTEHCAVHERTVAITKDHVCGNHLFGTPSRQWKELKGVQMLNPRFSGLMLVRGGAACEGCQHYTEVEEEDGVCAAVLRRGKPAHVHPRACCTRFAARKAPTDPSRPDK